MTALWNAIRVPVAFLVAPLGAPIMVVLIFAFHFLVILLAEPVAAVSVLFDSPAGTLVEALPLFLFTIAFSLIAYPITLVIGMPLYRILLKLEMTEFWIAPGLGCGIALALCLVLALLAGGLPAFVVLLSTLSGAAIGAIFWLIARPDRQMQAAQPPTATDDRSPEPNHAAPASRP